MRSRKIHALLSGSIVLLAIFVAVAARGDAPPFVPPSGWISAKPPAGMVGLWVHPGDTSFHQNMVLGAERTQLSAAQFDKAALAVLSRGLNGFKLGADEATTSCGKPAHYMSYATQVNGRQVLYEQMSVVDSGIAWFVIYTRLMSQPSLPEARSALTTLCGAELHQSAPQPAPPAQESTPPPPPPAQPTQPPPSPYATLEPLDR
jgi:hypothetical protein